jgi:hypothetical protein
MILTKDLLWRHRACKEQSDIFNSEFPDGMEFTRDNLERCVELKLDITWAERLITTDKRATYRAAIAPAWAAYLEARDTAAAYRAALATAWAAYLEARDTAEAAHQAARDTAEAAHQAAILDALVVALGGE